MGNYMELDKNSRNALDSMTQIIREADGVLDFSQQSVNSATTVFPSRSLTLPLPKCFMTNTNGVQTTLLTDCTFLAFSEVFQRTASAGTLRR